MNEAIDLVGSVPDAPNAREAFAKSMSEECGVDLTPTFMVVVDKVLTRLALRGYTVSWFQNDYA